MTELLHRCVAYSRQLHQTQLDRRMKWRRLACSAEEVGRRALLRQAASQWARHVEPSASLKFMFLVPEIKPRWNDGQAAYTASRAAQAAQYASQQAALAGVGQRHGQRQAWGPRLDQAQMATNSAQNAATPDDRASCLQPFSSASVPSEGRCPSELPDEQPRLAIHSGGSQRGSSQVSERPRAWPRRRGFHRGAFRRASVPAQRFLPLAPCGLGALGRQG